MPVKRFASGNENPERRRRIIMNKKNIKAAEIKAIGFSETFINRLLENLPNVEINTVDVEMLIDLAEWKDMNQIVLLNFDILIDNTFKIKDIEYITQFVRVFSPLAFSESEIIDITKNYIKRFWSAQGATFLTEKINQTEFIESIKYIISQNPSDVITSSQISDDGLKLNFADGSTALIPFAEVKRLAETDDVLWDTIKIGPDRTYITIKTHSGEDVPIPADVLASYAPEQKEFRKRKAAKEVKLTAKNFGKRLKKLREEKGLTQEQLAKIMKKSRWTIIRIEQGEYLPKVSDLQKIAKAMKMDFEDVLEG
jgi:putative transcriptional regulator